VSDAGHGHRRGPRWWRRRFLRVALVAGVLWVVSGVVYTLLTDGKEGAADDRGGPPPVVLAVVGSAVVATLIAYRRLARPVSELLGGADRIGGGDYEARVSPAGPRSVRTLGRAFNQMAERLDSAESERRRFLADVTHELRTPLAVLHAEVEAQLDGIHPRDDDHLELLRMQTGTLSRLVDDLRTLALTDAGQLTLHPEPVSALAIATDAVAAIDAAATSRGVAVDVTGSDAELDADPVRLGQVATNLLTNAVRHTPPGGRVTVDVAAPPGAVTITVVDTGSGIAGDPEAVFDRFAGSADSGGSGLGLTIARELVELHGGTLVAANHPGGGAQFTVTLPRPG
jgi:two-component system, OmpR family, sensor histidine kinase BaeS